VSTTIAASYWSVRRPAVARMTRAVCRVPGAHDPRPRPPSRVSDDGADGFQAPEVIPRIAHFEEDLLGVSAMLGGRRQAARLAVELLDRGRHERERPPVTVVNLLNVVVGHCLRVTGELTGELHHGARQQSSRLGAATRYVSGLRRCLTAASQPGCC
jgi:hypothetical protein